MKEVFPQVDLSLFTLGSTTLDFYSVSMHILCAQGVTRVVVCLLSACVSVSTH